MAKIGSQPRGLFFPEWAARAHLPAIQTKHAAPRHLLAPPEMITGANTNRRHGIVSDMSRRSCRAACGSRRPPESRAFPTSRSTIYLDDACSPSRANGLATSNLRGLMAHERSGDQGPNRRNLRIGAAVEKQHEHQGPPRLPVWRLIVELKSDLSKRATLAHPKSNAFMLPWTPSNSITLPPDRSTAIRAGSAAFPRAIFGTPSLHDSTRSLRASLACLYGRSSRRCPFPPRFGVCKLHHFRSAPSTSYRMNLPIQAARNQGVVSMRRPTPRGRPPEPYSPSSTTSHDGHITASPALDVDGLVNGSRGSERLAKGRVTSRSTLSIDDHAKRRRPPRSSVYAMEVNPSEAAVFRPASARTALSSF
ncbi:hypothetical protein THAOC_19253 [Thalassiosira oceanica]|uniref:Uncharacterized protein n=1 Tax=Thalassiosira oceanica TaxID=159749 RepID=K0SPS9_THAOC|nr:hypothetical protein THAOC_19253 [Thalassiosira oceanica]|eukprot:EJK60402.1 hypothetical protein THAOC_19253 [Thalassiosira oceanica]